MIETVYIRKDNKSRDEPCDVANALLEPAAYLGMVAGKHVPTDCVGYAHLTDPTTTTVDAWLGSNGYARVTGSVGDL